jgi:hypothetical protein
MFVDAAGCSFGALRPLHRALAPSDPYLNRRLLLNLMLANAGLYFTSIFTLVGAYIQGVSPRIAPPIMLVSMVVCFYSVVTVPLVTRKDWKQAILRGVAGVLIIIGFIAA